MNLYSPVAAMALLAMVAPVFSQTAVGNDTVFELPSFAPIDGKADHNTVAVNDNGDIFIVWSSSVYPLAHPEASKRRVEGAFLRHTSALQWDLYPTVILGETDPIALPGSTSIFLNGDTCRKADVVAIGNDFAVVWQRIETADTPNGQLECAFIQVPTSGDAVYNLADASGIGHILDSSLDPRTAGSMVDLAADRGSGSNNIVASYVSRTSVNSLPSGNAYDFDLRGVVFDFATVGLPPTVFPIQTLATGVSFDDFATGGPNGGRVLPDIVFDDFGNVVVAYEEFIRGDRFGGGAPDESNIHIRRYSVGLGGVLTQLNAQTVYGTSTTFVQRRPNILRTLANSDISLAWGELMLSGAETDIFHYSVSYPDAVGDAVLTDYAPVMTIGIEEELPIPIQFRTVRTVVIVADPPSAPKVIGHQFTTKPHWELLSDFNGYAPWRPATDVLENDPLRPNHGIIPMTVEGRLPGFESRIFFEILAI